MTIELLVTICMRAYVCVCVCVLKTKYSLVKYEKKEEETTERCTCYIV